jgi:NADH-quinone oxidoreductase subunit M
MVPLVVLMFVLGFYPNPFLQQTAPTTQFLLETVEEKRAAIEARAEAAPATAETPRPVPPAPPEAEEVSIELPERTAP